MALYSQWQALSAKERTPEDYDAFWSAYLPLEQQVYERILEKPEEPLSGTLEDLAAESGMDNVLFTGFLDGIDSSLSSPMDLDALEPGSRIALDVDFEKLYYNMLAAQADWLYTLPQWDGILDEAERKDIRKAYNKTRTVVKGPKVGRNDPCPCGSGKKYKHCCMNKD